MSGAEQLHQPKGGGTPLWMEHNRAGFVVRLSPHSLYHGLIRLIGRIPVA
jgi:hypothetical protein